MIIVTGTVIRLLNSLRSKDAGFKGKTHGISLHSMLVAQINGSFSKTIHPRNLTWNLKMIISKSNLFFQGSIFRFQPLVFWGVTFPLCRKTHCSHFMTMKTRRMGVGSGGFQFFLMFIPMEMIQFDYSNIFQRG